MNALRRLSRLLRILLAEDEVVNQAAGMDDYVTKPIRAAALVEALMQVTPRGAA